MRSNRARASEHAPRKRGAAYRLGGPGSAHGATGRSHPIASVTRCSRRPALNPHTESNHMRWGEETAGVTPASGPLRTSCTRQGAGHRC